MKFVRFWIVFILMEKEVRWATHTVFFFCPTARERKTKVVIWNVCLNVLHWCESGALGSNPAALYTSAEVQYLG